MALNGMMPTAAVSTQSSVRMLRVISSMPGSNSPRSESLKLVKPVKIRSESPQLTKSEQLQNKIKLESFKLANSEQN